MLRVIGNNCIIRGLANLSSYYRTLKGHIVRPLLQTIRQLDKYSILVFCILSFLYHVSPVSYILFIPVSYISCILYILHHVSAVFYRSFILYLIYPISSISYIYCILYLLYPISTVSYIFYILYLIYPISSISYIYCILYLLYPIYPVSTDKDRQSPNSSHETLIPRESGVHAVRTL